MGTSLLEDLAVRDCAKERQFHDGEGLSSMGHWDADKRIWCETPFWRELRKETLEMVLQHVGDERN